MNKGLKSYTKQLTNQIGSATVNVNLFKNDANMHITIPLLSTTGLSAFSASLVYNHQSKGNSGIFGKGFYLNYYAKIVTNGNSVTVQNADGSTDNYTIGEWNAETQMKAVNVSGHIEFEDRDGNKRIYESTSGNYPKKLVMKSGDVITVNIGQTSGSITNGKGDEIRFVFDSKGKVISAKYLYNDKIHNLVSFGYANDNLCTIQYENADGSVCGGVLISYQSTSISVSDNMTDYQCKFLFDSYGRVVSVVDGFGTSFKAKHTTVLTYGTNITKVTDWTGSYVEYYFDSEGIPLYEMNSDGYVVETDYDSKSKTLIAQSNPFLLNGQKNYFDGMSPDNFALSDVTKTKVTVTDTKWKNIVGSTAYRFKHQGTGRGNISFEVPVDCVATDSLTAIMWVKQLTNFSTDNYVRIDLQIGDQDSDFLKKPVVDSNYELVLLGATCKWTAQKARILISMSGNVEFVLGSIQVVKQDFGAFFQYDAQTNKMTLISKCGENAKISYNSDNKLSQITSFDSTIHNYEYNDKGYPVKSTSAYGVEIANEYDAKHASLLTKQTFSSKNKNKIVETKKQYTADGRHVIKEYDELGVCVAESTYLDDRLQSVKNATGSVTSFEYQNELISKMILKKDSQELAEAVYGYNYERQLTSVTLKNGSKYTFAYDFRGNISEVKLNGEVVFAYTYDENTGNLVKQKYGQNGDAYEFEYDANHLVSKVYYCESNGDKFLRYEYVYNNLKQLVKVLDAQGVVINSYEYNQDGKIVRATEADVAISYSYDNLDGINSLLQTVKGKKIHSSFSGVSRSQSEHPKKMSNRFSGIGHFGLFENKKATLYYRDNELNPLSESGLTFGSEGALPYLTLNSSTALGYKLTDKYIGDYENGCIEFWFKPDSVSGTQYLFGAQDPDIKTYYTVKIENGKLVLYIRERNKSEQKLLVSADSVIANKWNFFALNFYLRDDGLGYEPNCEVALILNADIQMYSSRTTIFNIDLGLQPVYYIGHRYDGANVSGFSGKIACVNISPRWYRTYDSIKGDYTVMKDFIEDCQYIDKTAQTLDISETVTLIPSDNTENLFEIYPLNNSVVSINGKRPVAFNQRTGVSTDKDKSFNFNAVTKRYAYVADGAVLSYNFGQTASGAVVFRAYTEALTAKQYLLEAKDANGNLVGLFRDGSKYLKLCCNGFETNTGFTMSNDAWHTVGLSFDKVIVSDSTSESVNLTLRVYFDGKTFTTLQHFDFSKPEFAIGRRMTATVIRHLVGTTSECNPFYGQIEMLCASKSYCSEATLNKLSQDIKPITKTNEFDDFGMVKQSCILDADKNVLTKSLKYKTRSDTRYISQRIEQETFALPGSTFTRKYTYDSLGNVTGVTDATNGSHTYRYDDRGFLVAEDNTSYEYDGNGNIIKVGAVAFSYDVGIHDRLIKVGNDSIAYDENSPLMPKSYKDNLYGFEGRRLVKLQNNNGQFEYKYNDRGLRIEKKSSAQGTFRYVYNGNKLATEIAPDYRLDFLYDENDNLYGFVKDGVSKYFYVRDFLQNILGFIDSTGQLVVKYKYTAYGKVTVTKDADGLADINPFKYKGYYFDLESGMYYCHTRYYVPEWGRWLNSDHSYFLDTNTATCVNLFAYCRNEPIGRIDENGNFSLLVALILIIPTIIGAVVGAVQGYERAVEANKKYDEAIANGYDPTELGLKKVNVGWETAKSAIFGGAVGLAAGGAVLSLAGATAGCIVAISAETAKTAMILGMTAKRMFAIGTLAFDVVAFGIMPLLNVEMQGIEVDTPADGSGKSFGTLGSNRSVTKSIALSM